MVTQAGTARARSSSTSPTASYTFRVLDNPTTGDAFGFRNAIQQYAQGRSDRLFDSLASLLHGAAPRLNFVPTGSPFTPNHMSANLTERTGAPRGTINMDPLTVAGLVDDASSIHSVTVNQMPHEMAHTRQSPATLASLLLSEGGAQAFADLMAGQAARQAAIPYTDGNYDGSYADYVRQVLAKQGRDWVLAGQFGNQLG